MRMPPGAAGGDELRCVTNTRHPAMLMNPIRPNDVGFGVNCTVSAPAPLPPAPSGNVIHADVVLAVHAQPAGAVTVTDRVPPVTVISIGETVKWHAAPPWVSVTAVPPMFSVAVRGDVEGFAATVTLTKPVPVPPAVLSVAHETVLSADHAQPVPAVTHTAPCELPPPTESAVGDTE